MLGHTTRSGMRFGNGGGGVADSQTNEYIVGIPRTNIVARAIANPEKFHGNCVPWVCGCMWTE